MVGEENGKVLYVPGERFLVRIETFLRTKLVYSVIVIELYRSPTPYSTSYTREEPIFPIIFTFPIKPLPTCSTTIESLGNADPAPIGTHQRLSDQAYPENVRVFGSYVTVEKSIQPPLSDQAYPEPVHGSRIFPDTDGRKCAS